MELVFLQGASTASLSSAARGVYLEIGRWIGEERTVFFRGRRDF